MHSSAIWVFLLLGAGIGGLLGWSSQRRRWRELRRYADACCRSGYLPDPPTERGRAFSKYLSRFAVWVQIGKITVNGSSNLQLPGPKIIAANHPHSVDPFVFGVLLDEPARYMTAAGVMKFCRGLGAMILGPCGAFCADLRRGKGMGAMNCAVQVLTTGQTLVIFPEGWAHLDGVARPFKRGVVYIARTAASQLGHPVPIVPVHLRHGACPGQWINRLNPRLQFFLMPMLFAIYRRGTIVTAGRPIMSSELPTDATMAAAWLREQILALPAANSEAAAAAVEHRLPSLCAQRGFQTR